jgi:hypothetical protein
LFVHPAGNRLNYPAVQQTFRVLLGRAGIRPRSDRCRPTIHGLRHKADGWVMRPAVVFPLLGAAELVL